MKTGNILVTGGAGFIGSYLADALVREGHRVTVLDNLSSGTKENLSRISGKFHFVKGSILNAALMKKHLRGKDAVFHLAAHASVPASVEKPLFGFKVNAATPLSLLKMATDLGVHRVVFASSAGTYGEPVYTRMDENHPNPDKPEECRCVIVSLLRNLYDATTL